jgi:hypothetical protein
MRPLLHTTARPQQFLLVRCPLCSRARPSTARVCRPAGMASDMSVDVAPPTRGQARLARGLVLSLSDPAPQLHHQSTFPVPPRKYIHIPRCTPLAFCGATRVGRDLAVHAVARDQQRRLLGTTVRGTAAPFVGSVSARRKWVR